MTPQTQALKKARELVQRFVDCDGISSSDYLDVRDAIDESLAQPEQEPVAHTAVFHCPNCEYPHHQVTHITGVAQPPWSPQRTWVGLNPQDYKEIFETARTGEHAVRLAEAKLREKNT